MNKKIYLSALVLPAVFAACTQEDLVDLNNKTQNRVVLEDLTFAEGVESRLAFEGSSFNSLKFQDGDGIGAYLIDSPSDIVTDAELAALRISAENDLQIESTLKAGYSLTSYIQGSHKFVYDEATRAWTTLDKMVEGNYIYVLPYQEKATREAITTALPQIQYLKYKEGTSELDDKSLMTQLIESGQPLAVGYEFLSRYNSEVAGSMKQIYAYPNITFTNEFKESVTIQKIVIKNKDKFALKGTLDLKKAAGELLNLDSDPKANDLKNSTVAGNWTKAVSGNFYTAENYTEDIVTPIDASKVDFIVVVAPENLTVASEASISFQAVIPAASYDKDDITIDVYTNKGVFQQTLDAVKFNNGLRYSSNNYSGGSLKANSAGDKYGVGAFTRGSDMTVAKEEITPMAEVVVIDTQDLLNVINGEPNNSTITIAPLKQVVVNKAVVDALGATKKLVVTQDITIEGEEDGLQVKNIDFGTNEVTVTEGLVTFADSKLESLVIAEDAVVIVDKNFPAEADIENKGTLNISAYNNLGNAISKTLGDIINWNVMNVSTPLVAGTIYNGGDDTPLYNEIVTAATINAYNGITAVVENNGALNIKASIAVSTINNNKYTKTDCADKIGVVTVDANKLLKTAGSNEGTITVNGEFRAVAAFANTGVINNNYGIENVYGAQLNNLIGGKIVVAEDAKYTSVNDNAGVIEIKDRQAEIHSDNNIGTILYNVAENGTFIVMATDKYNAVQFNGSTNLMVQMTTGLTPAPVVEALNLYNALNVVVAADGNYSFVSTINGLSINANVYATMGSDVTVANSLVIGSAATLHLGTGKTLDYNKSEGFVNGGTFRNMGVLNAMCKQPATGTWTGSGAYNWNVVNSVATTALQKDITNGGDVKLTEDVVLSAYMDVTKDVNVDLNGKELFRNTTTAEQPIFYANGSGIELTIDGDGVVETNNSNAIWAKGGATITIKGGNYINSTIFADTDGTINVEGGYFEAAWDAVTYGGQYTALNERDSSTGEINVTGGIFKNFNPMNNASEGPATSFVASGYHVEAYKDKACTVANLISNKATNAWKVADGDRYYKVVKD